MLEDRYKLHLSNEHKAALQATLRCFSRITTGEERRRIAIPLQPGAGKTQSVVAFLHAVHSLGYKFSITVTASRVEALCELYRDLIHPDLGGIPEAKVVYFTRSCTTANTPRKRRRGRATSMPRFLRHLTRKRSRSCSSLTLGHVVA
jgi:hypothetical protein